MVLMKFISPEEVQRHYQYFDQKKGHLRSAKCSDGKVVYKLELPSNVNVHHVFQMSVLKPFQEDKDDPFRGQSEHIILLTCTPNMTTK